MVALSPSKASDTVKHWKRLVHASKIVSKQAKLIIKINKEKKEQFMLAKSKASSCINKRSKLRVTDDKQP